MSDVTQLLIDWNRGDREALDLLMPLVYDELHRLAERYMRRERAGHTLQPTALVNEAYLQLVDQTRVKWQNRAHFFGVAAQMMRRITMLHVRKLRAAKRGGGNTPRITFDEELLLPIQRADDLIALDDALDDLAAFDPRMSRIVELRFFGGMKIEETAEALGVSTATVKREWRAAKAWLANDMRDDGQQHEGPGGPPERSAG
ncbi:MAG: sigma-70 family RNA polymerase sigma factor [Acidobacteriota bacterium]